MNCFLLTEQAGQFQTRLEQKVVLWAEGTLEWGVEVMNLHRETRWNQKSRVQVGSVQGKSRHHQEVSRILGKEPNGALISNFIYSIISQRMGIISALYHQKIR